MTIKVRIPSPCLSMLLQETAKSPGQCEGYLLGETNVEESRCITDAGDSTYTDEIISINNMFASTSSIIKTILTETGQLQSLLNEEHIIGWYKFCRRPDLKLSMKEKCIHRKLSTRLSNGSYEGNFVTLLINQNSNMPHYSNHSWNFCAFRLNDSRFTSCKIQIVNLNAANCGKYKTHPSIHHTNSRLPAAEKTLENLQLNFTSTKVKEKSNFKIVKAVSDANSSFTSSLNETLEEMTKTENLIKNALEEHEQLLSQLQKLELEQQEVENNKANQEPAVDLINLNSPSSPQSFLFNDDCEPSTAKDHKQKIQHSPRDETISHLLPFSESVCSSQSLSDAEVTKIDVKS